jgi:hypothetical protein
VALLPEPSLDYTDKDFDSLRARLRNLIRSVYPTWTDENVANFGNMLVELFAFVGDVLTFYQDANGRESRIVTATQRRNLIALCKLIGFSPTGAAAAQAQETFTLAASPVGDVDLPVGFLVSTKDVTSPQLFQLLSPIHFAGGTMTLTQTATVENSQTVEDSFASSGLPNQSIQLSAKPYVDQSAVVSATNGSYAQQPNLLESGPTDLHYTLSIDQSDVATVTFGNGVNGALPVGTINVASKEGGGAAGNVEAGNISSVPSSVFDSHGNQVQLVVSNAAKAQGGLDRQSMASIKILAPASVRSETRCVTSEDFETNALKVAGVARAKMITSDDDPAVAENTGNMFIVPVGGGLISPSLQAAVLAQITTAFPHTLTFEPFVFSAQYLVINVSMIVFPRPGVVGATLGAQIRAALAALFAPSNADGTPNPSVGFGASYVDENNEPTGVFPLDDAWTAIKAGAPSLRYIGGAPSDFLLNGAHADLPILARQFPALGSVTIKDGTTGANL